MRRIVTYPFMMLIVFYMMGAFASFEIDQSIANVALKLGTMRCHNMHFELLASPESHTFYIGNTLLSSYAKK